eukprot:CAMPEP_0119385740 /NCGR_PEP_ID=MMETSP1334-20130426/92580_1 /TAXON_ID=127549 /ORGANISM="Calcidiscus leptoporus, Strain RCC1130" /LENGTH=48 /DNA_ID= /DNA_START= /DNA_END= /DNA_ORIENTATION=
MTSLAPILTIFTDASADSSYAVTMRATSSREELLFAQWSSSTQLGPSE